MRDHGAWNDFYCKYRDNSQAEMFDDQWWLEEFNEWLMTTGW